MHGETVKLKRGSAWRNYNDLFVKFSVTYYEA